ncbi:MAG TPA: hypothetical protein VF384_00795 [Planctomycetota bacterium]
MTEARRTSPQRLAAGYFLGFVAVALLVLLWLRGGGRFVLPLVVIGLVALLVTRIVRALRAPLP